MREAGSQMKRKPSRVSRRTVGLTSMAPIFAAEDCDRCCVVKRIGRASFEWAGVDFAGFEAAAPAVCCSFAMGQVLLNEPPARTSPNGDWLSASQIVSAHLWRRVFRSSRESMRHSHHEATPRDRPGQEHRPRFTCFGEAMLSVSQMGKGDQGSIWEGVRSSQVFPCLVVCFGVLPEGCFHVATCLF